MVGGANAGHKTVCMEQRSQAALRQSASHVRGAGASVGSRDGEGEEVLLGEGMERRD